MRRLGIGSRCATLRFAGISQPWLKDLAKRWTRWRLSTGLEAQTCYRGVRALTRISGFLAAAGVAGPGGISRDVLERYLADLAAAMAGREPTATTSARSPRSCATSAATSGTPRCPRPP